MFDAELPARGKMPALGILLSEEAMGQAKRGMLAAFNWEATRRSASANNTARAERIAVLRMGQSRGKYPSPPSWGRALTRQALIAFVGFAVVTLLGSEWPYLTSEVVASPVPKYVLLFSLAGLFWTSLVHLLFKNYLVSSALALFFLALVGGLLSAGGIADYYSGAARDKAQRIIRAVDAHNEKNGQYPSSVDALIPEELDGISPMRVSLLREGKVTYRLTGSTYVLAFPAGSYCQHIFESNARQWTIRCGET